MTDLTLRRIISATRHLLLDFDGPVCSVFAGTAASEVAEQLRQALQAAGFTLPAEAEADPLEVFRLVANVNPEAAVTTQQLLTVFETRAVATARPTRGSADLIISAYRTGRTVSIVSNNSSAAISAYLADHRLDGYIRAVFGRDGTDPALMKPSPYRVRQAVGSLGADPGECVFVGDSPTDVVAGRLAGVRVIGYANKPGKIDALTSAQADAVTTDESEITSAIRSAPRVALPN
jgi:beta-phosphoglucomutase-like phosphatase (HAD superfamily)